MNGAAVTSPRGCRPRSTAPDRAASLALRLAPPPARRRLLVKHAHVDPGVLEHVVFKLAETRPERDAAFRVLHDAYVNQGLIEPRPGRLYVPPFSLLPDSTILVAVVEGAVRGTLTLVEDSALGLPMEALYREEVERVRHRGRRLAEVSATAVSGGEKGRGLALMLYALLFRWSYLHRDIDDLLVAVHPRTEPLFCDVLLFERVGSPRAHLALARAPAVALHLDLPATVPVALKRYRGLRPHGFPATLDFHRLLFGDGHPCLQLPEPGGEGRSGPPRWDAADWSYFARRTWHAGPAEEPTGVDRAAGAGS